MRAIKLSVLVAAALGAVARAGAGADKPGPAATPDDAEGEHLYRSHCAACHRLRDPKDYTGERWAEAVEKFGARAHLSPQEQRKVLAYLQAHAKDAPPAPGSERP